MAVDMHFKIDQIPGNSAVTGFTDQIQVEEFNWHMEQPTSFAHSAGGGSGKVKVGDLSFVHFVDKASPKLMQFCCTGKHVDQAVLTCRKAGGDNAVDFLKITLKHVVVSSVAPAGTKDDMPREHVSLAFAQYSVEYQAQDNKGGKSGGPVVVSYDIQAAKAG